VYYITRSVPMNTVSDFELQVLSRSISYDLNVKKPPEGNAAPRIEISGPTEGSDLSQKTFNFYRGGRS
jgi:hypothetical protein